MGTIVGIINHVNMVNTLMSTTELRKFINLVESVPRKDWFKPSTGEASWDEEIRVSLRFGGIGEASRITSCARAFEVHGYK